MARTTNHVVAALKADLQGTKTQIADEVKHRESLDKDQEQSAMRLATLHERENQLTEALAKYGEE